MNNHAVAYYQDGIKLSAEEGLVGEPSRGVQAIVQDHPQVGREIITGGDYFIRKGDRWIAVDINGLFDFFMDHPDVAFGRMISGEEYSKVMAIVNLERPKGRTAMERKK